MPPYGLVTVHLSSLRGSQGPATGCIEEMDILDVSHQDAHGVLGRVRRVVGHDAKGEAISRLVGALQNEQHVMRACSGRVNVGRAWSSGQPELCVQKWCTYTRAGRAQQNAGHSCCNDRAQQHVCRT